MAIQILPILRAIAPLAAEASTLVTGLRSSGKAARVEDRVARIEQDTIRAGEVLTGLARQMEAIATQLRAHAEATQAMERRIRVALACSVVGAIAGIAALVIVLARAGGA